MSLSSRIATVFPYPGVTIKIKRSKASEVVDVFTKDGKPIELDNGYDIIFQFSNLGIQATRHIDTLNLSNRAMQDIVEEVVGQFDEMLDQIRADNEAGNVH